MRHFVVGQTCSRRRLRKDRTTMLATVELALAAGVAIGAHPDGRPRGLAEWNCRGRRPRELAETAASSARRPPSRGGKIAHAQPHGAFTTWPRDFSRRDCAAGGDRSESLVLFGSSRANCCGRTARAAARRLRGSTDLPTRWLARPARSAGRVIFGEAAAVAQAGHAHRSRSRAGGADEVDGSEISVAADTVCLHGDVRRPAAASPWPARRARRCRDHGPPCAET